jgi:hypothetical protein
MWSRWIRIRIRNTGYEHQFLAKMWISEFSLQNDYSELVPGSSSSSGAGKVDRSSD